MKRRMHITYKEVFHVLFHIEGEEHRQIRGSCSKPTISSPQRKTIVTTYFGENHFFVFSALNARNTSHLLLKYLGLFPFINVIFICLKTKWRRDMGEKPKGSVSLRLFRWQARK